MTKDAIISCMLTVAQVIPYNTNVFKNHKEAGFVWLCMQGFIKMQPLYQHIYIPYEHLVLTLG